MDNVFGGSWTQKKIEIVFEYAKAYLQIMMRDIEGAEESLIYAEEYISEVESMPYYHSNFLISKFMLDLSKFEESIKAGIKQ